MTVDLNADLGEGYGIYTLGNDSEILQVVTSANIACGFHAGDPIIMDKTIAMCKKYNVGIGAHPSYPDLHGFGRRDMNLSLHEISCYVTYQIGAIHAVAKKHGMKVTHCKPHGALYNKACVDSALAQCLCEVVANIDDSMIFIGLANSEMNIQAKKKGLKYAHEVFADRAYNSDGSLVSRNKEGAVLHDKDVVVKRILRMLQDGKITSLCGQDIDIQADTICVHGDTPESLAFVKSIKKALQDSDVSLSTLTNFIT